MSSIVSTFVSGDIGMTAVLTAIITPLVNTCSTVIFEKYSDKSSSGWQKLIKILKNPLVLSSILGVAANLLRLPIPTVIISGVVKKLAAMATPAALLSLGATFDFSRLSLYKKQLAIISVGKLLVQPAVIVALAVLLGIRGADLIAIVIFSGSPTAVNSYSTAVSMGGNSELAGQTVIFTSCLSILTLFALLCGIGLMGWI
ncbi:MAG: AEC family transporter [Firmicutes bacterium]|nr:AEC family transporter [Bacillota bacterium]